MNNKSSIKLLIITAVVLFITVVTVGIVEIKQIYTIYKMKNSSVDGIWLTDSITGKSTYVDMSSYVDEKVAVNEIATTSYGVNYSKEGEMSLLDVDCDVKEAFEILDCIRMYVNISKGDDEYHLAYAKGSDGYTYLVETDEDGNILRDGEGNANMLERCDFADLYLGEE